VTSPAAETEADAPENDDSIKREALSATGFEVLPAYIR
jgi:hypothetical protein